MSTTAEAGAGLENRVAGLIGADPAVLEDPFSLYRELRELGGVHEHDSMLLLTRYEHVKEAYLLGDSYVRGARAGQHLQAAKARLPEDLQVQWQELTDFNAAFMIRTRHERHDRLRSIAHRALTPRRIAALESSINDQGRRLISDLTGHPTADLTDFAYRMPLRVLLELLGIPAEDHEMVHEWSAKITMQIGSLGDVDPARLRASHAAMRGFCDYIDAMLQTRVRASASRSDLLSDLLAAEGDGRLSASEITAMFAELLIAGHETTTALIGNGLLELMRQPEQWRWLCQEPTRAPVAVEELLRFVSPVAVNPRTVGPEGIELAGRRYPAGMTVLPLLAAANRDPAVFKRPESLDLARPDAGRHIAFGFGPHFCIGNQLARRTTAVALQMLATHFPYMELIDASPDWYGTVMLRRPRQLLISLGTKQEG